MNPSDRLVDIERGIISRKIFINDGIFAGEAELIIVDDICRGAVRLKRRQFAARK
jgi:hypothetical protein